MTAAHQPQQQQRPGLVASPMVERLYPKPASRLPWLIRGPLTAGRLVLALIWCGLARPILGVCARRPSLVAGVVAVSVGVAYWFWVAVIGLIMAPFALTAVASGLYLIQFHAVERRIEKRFLAAGWQPRPAPAPSSIPVPTGDTGTDVAALRAHLVTHYGISPHPPKPRRRRRAARAARVVPAVVVLAAVAASVATIAYRVGTPEVLHPPEWSEIHARAEN